MDILVTARKFELNDSLREFVERRLSRLARYDGRVVRVEVTLTQEKNRRRVEALAVIEGDVDAHAETTANEFREALNKVSAKLTRQIKRRLDQRNDHQAPRLGRDIEPEQVVEESDAQG